MSKPPHPFEFFGLLNWLDGRPLMSTIEPYRQRILEDVLFSFEPGGRPRYNMALCGRAKKNWKTSDLILAALYKFLAWPTEQGNDCFILANDLGQANDDLTLAKKLIAINPILANAVDVKSKWINRKDGRGVLQILPAKDVAGAHGKVYGFLGLDEIHGYRNYDLIEALAPDPTRNDVLIWITSYAGIRHAPGIPLYDYMRAGRAGTDPRMFFSWYGGDYSTDPALTEVTPEQRANPSLETFVPDYLDQQRKRLPTSKYRRLHLNLPGAPEGAAFSGEHVMPAIPQGRRLIKPVDGVNYVAFVDMSGGSDDDAVLAIAHWDKGREIAILDRLVAQDGDAPFNPRHAVRKFAGELQQYRCARVTGDSYGGQTNRMDFQQYSITYEVTPLTKHQLYEALEPRLNAYEVELLDHPNLQEQLLTLVHRGAGGKIDHLPGDHDDYSNSAAGALWLAAHMGMQPTTFNAPIVFKKDHLIPSNPSFSGPVDITGRWPG